MSDSEYCTYEENDEHYEETPIPIINKPKKTATSKSSSSEDRVVSKVQKSNNLKIKIAPKRSQPGETKDDNVENHKKRKTAPKKSLNNEQRTQPRTSTFDLFGLLTEEETSTAEQQGTSAILPSVLTSRVANGSVVRRKHIDGEFYVEVKVYKTSDAISTRPEERWQKTLNSVKIQMNPDGDDWNQLQGFFKAVRNVLDDAESVFYATKAN